MQLTSTPICENYFFLKILCPWQHMKIFSWTSKFRDYAKPKYKFRFWHCLVPKKISRQVSNLHTVFIASTLTSTLLTLWHAGRKNSKIDTFVCLKKVRHGIRNVSRLVRVSMTFLIGVKNLERYRKSWKGWIWHVARSLFKHENITLAYGTLDHKVTQQGLENILLNDDIWFLLVRHANYCNFLFSKLFMLC
jgi:hypothetical protein